MPESSINVDVDLSDSNFDVLLTEELGNHTSLMIESRGNAQHVHGIARFSGVRKYDEVDPIQAAAAEVVLRLPLGK